MQAAKSTARGGRAASASGETRPPRGGDELERLLGGLALGDGVDGGGEGDSVRGGDEELDDAEAARRQAGDSGAEEEVDDAAMSNGGDRASDDSWPATDMGSPDEASVVGPAASLDPTAAAGAEAAEDDEAVAAAEEEEEEAAPAEVASLLVLPDELLMRILVGLEVPDLASAAVTCRRLARLLLDGLSFPRLQEAKLLRRLLDAETEDHRKAAVRLAAVTERAQLPWIHVMPSVAQALGYLAHNPRLVSLNANHCREVTTDVLPQLSQLRGIKDLDLSCNKALTNQDIIYLLSSLRNLEVLSLRKCTGISDVALQGLPITGRRLKSLDLRACPGIVGTFLVAVPRTASARGPAGGAARGATSDGSAEAASDPLTLALETLRTMRLPEPLILGLAALAPNLRDLTAQDARHVTDQGCTILATLTSLKCLKLRGCVRISSTGMAALAAGLPRLETLGLRGRRGCQLSALTGLAELRSLRLSWKGDMYDEHLADLVVRFPLLVKLDLTNCIHVSDEGIRLAATLLPLVSFKVIDCPLVTDAGYAHILQLRTLEKLSVGWTAATPPVTSAAARQAARNARASLAAASATTALSPLPARAGSGPGSPSPTTPPAPAGPAPPNTNAAGGGGSMSSAAAALLRRPLELFANPFMGSRPAPPTAAAYDDAVLGPAGHVRETPTMGALATMRQSIARALSQYDGPAASASGGGASPRPSATAAAAAAAATDEAAARASGVVRLTLLMGLRTSFAPGLRSLRLHHNGPADVLPIHAAVMSIATLASLEDLRLCGWPLNDVHVDRLARGLPAVRTLILSRSRITSAGIVSIGDGMRRLVYLDLRHCSEVTGEGLGVFRRMNAPLHTLVLSACAKLDTACLRTVASIQNLHWLDLSLSPVRTADLRDLARSVTLRKLVLRACPHVSATSALIALQTVSHLHTVDLTGCPLYESPAARRGAAIAAATGRHILRVHGWGQRPQEEIGPEPFNAARLETLRRPFAKVLLQTQTGEAAAVVVDVFV